MPPYFSNRASVIFPKLDVRSLWKQISKAEQRRNVALVSRLLTTQNVMIFINLWQLCASRRKIPEQYTCPWDRYWESNYSVLSVPLPDATQWLIIKMHGFYVIHLRSKRKHGPVFSTEPSPGIMKLKHPKHNRTFRWPLLFAMSTSLLFCLAAS